ncbi:hypothetical protein MPER_04573 [Moniliophthora perniciosa FA553]|nr:hypothetical protein MPER_04573 [Moniliophthora perniciosa FA553]
MHLGKVEQLYMDPWDTTVEPFLEWCASTHVKQVFQGAKEITIRNIHREPRTLSISALSVFAENFLNVSHISLRGVGFSTFKQFSDFLTSFPQLQSLECTQMHAPRKDTKELVVLHPLRKLRVDRDTFFGIFYSSIAFSCLEDLDFYDIHPVPYQESNLTRIQEVGYMLSYTGHRLRRLRLALEAYPLESYIHNIRSRISKSVDLSIKAPVLRELVLHVYETMVIAALTFENTHRALRWIKIGAQALIQRD